MNEKILTFLAILFVITLVIEFLRPTDSTDVSRFNRSGLAVYTDNATGVQYIKAGMFGGLTPRLNADGSLYQEPRP